MNKLEKEIFEEKIGGVTINYEFYDDDAIVYNEGDDPEQTVLEAFRDEKDIFEILRNDNRWQILYQLAPQRQNIAIPMDITETDHVLEIGSGTGAITCALSKKAGSVDCIDLSKRRSLANAYRNKSAANVSIYVGNFEEIALSKQYDVAVVIGALEYARRYIKSDKPFEMFLKRARDALKPSGRIYIGIENRLGLKYFAGDNEDHCGRPFAGIEGYINDTRREKAKTFSKSELEKLLSDSGFGDLFFYYPMPDYKLPVLIYSDEHLPNAGDYVYAGVGGNYAAAGLKLFDDEKAFATLYGAKEFTVFANSFLVEARKI
ncbi:MAG: class I SAM-dependent methyltransferase [Treponema sp.]|jgi:SAM-dependent methyltransferase|nr:class I SAM-dependent methyltransferase [Treponema sp.]